MNILTEEVAIEVVGANDQLYKMIAEPGHNDIFP